MTVTVVAIRNQQLWPFLCLFNNPCFSGCHMICVVHKDASTSLLSKLPYQQNKFNEICVYNKHHTKLSRWYLLVQILKIDIKYTFLVRFHISIFSKRFSLPSLTSSHVQIWKIITKTLDEVKVFPIFRPISALTMSTPFFHLIWKIYLLLKYCSSIIFYKKKIIRRKKYYGG